MPKISPWDNVYQRHALREESREFALPDGRTMALKLRELDPLTEGVVWDKRDDYIARYVKGEDLLFDSGGVKYPASRSILSLVAALEVMEVPDDGDKPYTLLDWVKWASMKDGPWEEIVKFANSFSPEADVEGNSSGSGQNTTAPTGSSSEPSPATDSPTPNP